MKRTGHLFEKICDSNNIRRAIIYSSRNKTSLKSVKRILYHMDFYILKIQKILQDELFENHYYESIEVYEKLSNKIRHISRPKYFPDQIVHWAIMLQLEPILKRGMDYYCSASIKGRGSSHIRQHLIRIIKSDKKNTKYVLKYDIHHFYENIDHSILITKLRRLIKDNKLLNLLEVIINYLDKGLPIGTYLSQWLANFYLQDHDHYLREQLHVKYMFRYMDDVVVLDSNYRRLVHIKEEIINFVSLEGLSLKDNSDIWKFDLKPIDFVGYQFFKNSKVTIRQRIWRNIRRSFLKAIYHCDKLTVKLRRKIASYWGYVINSNSFYILNYYVCRLRSKFQFIDKYFSKDGKKYEKKNLEFIISTNNR